MHKLWAAFAGSAAIALTVTGIGAANATPPTYDGLSVDPNLATDSLAYASAPPIIDPNGQPGISTVYTHRLNDRQIDETVLVLASDPAATEAASAAQRAVSGGQTSPAAVGAAGTVTTGRSSDGSQSVAKLTFTQGNVAAIITFTGPLDDQAPTDLLLDYGRLQDQAIIDWQTA